MIGGMGGRKEGGRREGREEGRKEGDSKKVGEEERRKEGCSLSVCRQLQLFGVIVGGHGQLSPSRGM